MAAEGGAGASSPTSFPSPDFQKRGEGAE